MIATDPANGSDPYSAEAISARQQARVLLGQRHLHAVAPEPEMTLTLGGDTWVVQDTFGVAPQLEVRETPEGEFWLDVLGSPTCRLASLQLRRK